MSNNNNKKKRNKKPQKSDAKKVNPNDVAKEEDLHKYLLQLCVCFATINRLHVKNVLRQAGEHLISLSERMIA